MSTNNERKKITWYDAVMALGVIALMLFLVNILRGQIDNNRADIKVASDYGQLALKKVELLEQKFDYELKYITGILERKFPQAAEDTKEILGPNKKLDTLR